MPEDTNAQVIFTEHWNHCRHIESERAWFMNVYMVVIAAVAGFISQTGFDSVGFGFLLGFTVALTLVGLVLNIRWAYSFEFHRTTVSKVAWVLWGDDREDGVNPSMDVPGMRLGPLLRTRYWFVMLYFFLLAAITAASFFLDIEDSAGAVTSGLVVWQIILTIATVLALVAVVSFVCDMQAASRKSGYAESVGLEHQPGPNEKECRIRRAREFVKRRVFRRQPAGAETPPPAPD